MAEAPASIFAQLNSSTDAKEQEKRAQDAIKRQRRLYEQDQARIAELADTNSTLPCTINSIRILNAVLTRRGFLQRIFDPLLKANERPRTLAEALEQVHSATQKLQKFGIFEESITPYIDRPDPTDPSTTPTDIDVYLSVKEKGRLSFKSGTNVGNTEGDAYGSVIFKNAFGGAETLAANATYGTRTRSSYQGTFSTPLFSNPDLNLELGGVASSTQNTWASHEEVLKAAWTKLRWLAGDVHRHEVEYNGSWRQITGLASNASPTVRMDAGDSVKSSVAHTWLADWRDNPLMPQYGVYAKTVNEIAGIGPLGGDVAFWKGQVETQGAVPVRIPGVRNSGVTFTTGLRAGILCPLTLAGRKTPEASRINDRFLLGGPTDVRGFREAGLGPRDGPDSVGGDVYTAWSANLLFPLPGLGWNETFKGQIFMNCGRLLALQGPEASGAEKEGDGSSVGKRLKSTIGQLADGYPSTSAGLGLVYAHPIARLEVNLVLPLVVRKGEAARKGLQWGIGINFL